MKQRMNMMLVITFALSTTMINSLLLNLNHICHCSQLIQEYDCLNTAQECTWDYKSKECYDTPCSQILISNFCLQQSWRCFWTDGQCNDFIACSNLVGKSEYQCQVQNIYCPASNGTNCQSVEYLQTCQSISSPNNCNTYISAAGPCMWNGQNCIVATSCSQLQNNATSSCSFQGCYLNNVTNQCQPKTCSLYLTQLQCVQGVLTFGSYLDNMIGCYWNFQTNQCQEYEPSQLNYLDCYSYSGGTYHWNNKNENKGDCVPCYQQLLILSVIMALLI